MYRESVAGSAFRRDTEETATALQETLRGLNPGLPVKIETWDPELSWVLFPARVATVAFGVLGLLGAMLAITGIFGIGVVRGEQTHAGAGHPCGAGRRWAGGSVGGAGARLPAAGSQFRFAGIVLGGLAT